MNSAYRTAAASFWFLVFAASSATPTLAQRAIEQSGIFSQIISPTLYNSQPPLSGTYYNAHPLRINNTLFMFVQGGQFAPPEPSPAVSFCNGDGVILFETPYTSTGVLGTFSPVSRISLCTSPAGSEPPYHHWSPANVFVLGSTYYMIGEGDYGQGLGEQAALWTATFNSQTNQFTGSWQPFMTDVPGGGIAGMMVQPDPTRTWDDGFTHQSVRGFARMGQQVAVEVRVDFSDEWCSTSLSTHPYCAQIQFQENGNWVSLVDGNLNFTPDTFLADFKVNELTSQTIASNGAASPPYELWGAYNEPSNMCGECQTGPTGGGFQYYQVNADWSLGNTYVIHSHIRCMPSGLSPMRSFAAPLYFGSNLYLYSSDNDANICQTESNPFVGMYIVVTELGLN